MSEAAQTIATTTTTPTPPPAASTPPTAETAVKTATVPLAPPQGSSEHTPKDGEAAPRVEVDGSIAKHFAELKRQREALQADKDRTAKEAAERAKSDEADRKELEAFKRLKAEAKKDPFKAMQALELTADDIAKGLMHSEPEKPAYLATIEEKLANLEKELAAEKKAKADAAQAEIDRKSDAAMRADLEKVLQDPEFKRARKDPELVLSVMTDHWINTFDPSTKRGQILDYKIAANHVEKYLAKIAEADTDQPPGDKKPAAQPPAQGPKGSQTAQAKEPQQKTVTITNKTTADTPPGEPPPDPDANKKRAIRNLEERMKARRAALAGKAEAQQ